MIILGKVRPLSGRLLGPHPQVLIIAPEQWTAFGTVVAAVGTVGTLIYAVASARSSRRETIKLQNQLADEKRKAQASGVCAWITGDQSSGIVVVLSNSSPEPVFEAVLYLVWVQGAAYNTGELAEHYGQELQRLRAVLRMIPPAQTRVDLEGPSNSPMQGQLGVELAFNDAAGRHWVRRSSGTLELLDDDPVTHYGISRPFRYTSLGRWPPSVDVLMK